MSSTEQPSDKRATGPRSITFWELRLRAAAPWILTLAAVIYVIATVFRHTHELSPFDEGTYFDYLFALPDDPIRQQGEPYTLATRELMSCFGVVQMGTQGMPCGSDYSNLSVYPQQGLTSADSYTPLFFWIVWGFAKLISLLGADFIDAARMTNVLWLVPTILAVYASLRLLRVPVALALSLGLLYIAAPLSYWSFTYLSTDATVHLSGALSLLVAIRFLTGRGSIWWLVAVAAGGQLLKMTAFLGPLLAGILLAVYWLLGRKTAGRPVEGSPLPSRRWVLPLVLSGIVAVVLQLLWIAIRNSIAVGPPPDQGVVATDGLAILLLQSVLRFITSGVSYFPFFPGSPYSHVDFYIGVVQVLVIGAIGAGVYRIGKDRLSDAVSLSTGVALATFGPMLFVMLSAMGIAFDIPGRYAAPIVPACFLVMGVVAERRWVRWVLSIFSVLAYVYVVVVGPEMF